VTALILIKDGMAATDAIDLIRKQRHSDALFNESFVNWLMASAADFISPPSAQCA
jgi:hypothetical protein